MRLDRDRSPANTAWDTLGRGDVFAIDPAPRLDRPRVGADAAVTTLTAPAVSLSGDSKSR
jgi:hypothetical protein